MVLASGGRSGYFAHKITIRVKNAPWLVTCFPDGVAIVFSRHLRWERGDPTSSIVQAHSREFRRAGGINLRGTRPFFPPQLQLLRVAA